MINQNKNLRALGLQGLNLSDSTSQVLVEPLGNTLNVEAVNFSQNRLGSGFVTSLVQRLISNRGQRAAAAKEDTNSVLTDETGGNDEEIFTSMFDGKERDGRNLGFVSLSFEGNTGVGDKGASAIAQLI